MIAGMTTTYSDRAVRILDNGFVDLQACCASDLSVVNAARVSFATRHEIMELGDAELINYLMREEHGSPFEHNFFSFHVRAPLFVVSEWKRHRIGSSYNEQSGRYSEFEEIFFVPETVRSQVGKPGAYKFEPVDTALNLDVKDIINVHNQMSYQMYRDLLTAGVAKEQARLVLPPTLYTEFWFSVNARSLMNFLHLRNDDHAMEEIRVYAAAMEKIFAVEMPVTYQSFIANGRKAP